MILILLLSPPTLDHSHPTREQAIEIVEYWQAEVERFESGDLELIDERVESLTLELLAWGGRYDVHRTKQLQSCLARILELSSLKPKVRIA